MQIEDDAKITNEQPKCSTYASLLPGSDLRSEGGESIIESSDGCGDGMEESGSAGAGAGTAALIVVSQLSHDQSETRGVSPPPSQAQVQTPSVTSALPTKEVAIIGSPIDDTSNAKYLLNPLQLHLVTHAQKGRGVYSSKAIKAGVEIEESPVLVIKREEWIKGNMNDCILGEYGFCWKSGGMGIGLGMGECRL
jgi:hypothetical protein